MLKLKPGVVSVSFRPNSFEEILSATRAAGLSVIEWGGDVHCIPGDIVTAERLASESLVAGIELITYGSYFRFAKNPVEEFSACIESALALGVKIIRVWGNGYIPECSGELWDRSVSDVRAMCEMADAHDITVCLECHNGCVTEEYHSALAFMRAVDHPRLRLYWQINEMRDKAYNLEAAEALAPYVECIHTFYFKPDGKKGTLAEGLDDWRDYLEVFKHKAGDRTIPMLLEFMPDGRMGSLKTEGATLIELISSMDMLA